MATTYEIGDTIRLTGTFTLSSVNTDPTTITLKVQDPSGNEDTYTYALSQVAKSATGIYYKDITLDEKGVWHYRFVGTGTVAAAYDGYVFVRESQF